MPRRRGGNELLDAVDVEDERSYNRRRDDVLWEIAKALCPILIAWGLAVYTSRTEAADVVKTKVAVLEATEQSHFDEIQRTLKRLDDWIARQEPKR